LSLLAQGYADQLIQCDNVEVIFGPAYKGIPFVAATAVALSQIHGKSVPWGLTVKKPKIMVKAVFWLVLLLKVKKSGLLMM
jgi:orotate phosphoribosyltransferase